MSKQAEIDYVARIATVLNTQQDRVERYLLGKPYTDANRQLYIMDIGQILRLLPPAPARVLDLGVGPGWTSAFLAESGYSVLGLDIAPDMVALARRKVRPGFDLRFEVHDYEHSIPEDGFDAVVIYDALHHALDEGRVIANALTCLKPGGRFITMEPGRGHSVSEEARDAIARFGTTEKDMEFSHQAALMRAAGFESIHMYLRVSQLPTEDLETPEGRVLQSSHMAALFHNTIELGSSCVVMAVKGGGAADPARPAAAPETVRPARPPFLQRLKSALRLLIG
jgi:SAM-dependent methyltransferase